ncbi:MAG: hypothetical protein U0230_08600 [Polyangiales bacterium]
MDPTLVLRPVLALLVVAAVPGTLLAAARLVLAKRGAPSSDDDHAERFMLYRGALSGGIALAVALGANVLDSPGAWASPRGPAATVCIFVGIGLAAVAVGQGKRTLGLAGRPVPLRDLPLGARLELGLALVLGLPLLLGAGRLLAEPGAGPRMALAYLAGTLLVAHGLARWPVVGLPRPPTFSLASFVSVTLAAAPALLAATTYTATALPLASVASLDADRAAARALLAPRDPQAALAQGWADTRSGHLDSAERRLAKAEALRADEVARLELETEIEASRGECEAARRAFRRAVGLRAERTFARVLDERLPLGDYAIPPALVRRCGVAPAGD